MVAFRGLAWANKTPSNRLDRSDFSVTTPSSPAEIEVPSVPNLVAEFEIKEAQTRRISSVGDRPSTPTFRAQPFHSIVPYSRTPSPRTVPKVAPLSHDLLTVQEEATRGVKARSTSSDLEFKVVPLVFSTTDGEVVQHPYFVLPTPSESEDIETEDISHHEPQLNGEEVNPPAVDLEILPPLPGSPFTFSQSPRTDPRTPLYGAEEFSPLASPFAPIQPVAPLSPLNIAVDSASESLYGPLPESRPDAPRSFYHVDPSSAVTFNTSVQDLIQEAPDNPIGGKLATTMEVSTDVKGKSKRSKSPKPKEKRPLYSRSTNSETVAGSSLNDEKAPMSPEPFANLVSLAQLSPRPATPMSEASMKMVTAPGTPTFGGRRNDFSDMSEMTDGPGSVTEIKDFAAPSKANENSENMCSDSDHNEGDPTAIPLPSSAGVSPAGFPASDVPGSSFPASKSVPNELPATGGSPNSLPAFPVSSDGLPLTNLPPNSLPLGDISAPGAPPGSGLPDLGKQNLEIPSSNISRGLAVPADISGALDSPALPAPNKSKSRVALGKGKRKGQKFVRRGRSLVLRRSVLSLVIGRQLAGPTVTALKLVGKGVPVDPGALKDAGTVALKPAPVSGGVPASPVPMTASPWPLPA